MTKRAESARSAARSLFIISLSSVLLTGCASENTSPDCADEHSCEPPDAPANDAPITSPAQPGGVPGTRSFQMALWDNADAIDSDMAFFSEGQAQPSERSILRLTRWWDRRAATNSSFARKISSYQYDWSRIAAVLIDEPYWYNTGASDRSNPCRSPQDPRNDLVARTQTQLADAAKVINAVSPSTRFWVNFSLPEVQWASDSQCPVPINQPYIDVVSLDSYWGTFAEVARPHYDWLASHRASEYQQFALLPGTFFRSGMDDQYERAAYLGGYFEYANKANQTCDLPVGRVGVTGNWDGCPVWLVLGWLGPTVEIHGQTWRGVFDPLSFVISAEWRAQIAKPKRGPILGQVESYEANSRTLKGWAIDGNAKASSAYIEIWSEGQQLGSTVANLPRTDVGERYGRYETGFAYVFPDEHMDDRCRSLHVYAVSSVGAPHNRSLLSSAAPMTVCP